MSSAAVLILAVSVSIDAFAVSVGGALCDRTGRCRRNAVNAAAFFGTFQIVMPLIGYFAATLLAGVVAAVDHWLAFLLLGVVGGKMIYEGIRPESEEERRKEGGECSCPPDFFAPKALFIPAVATSLDALAVGVGLALIDVNIVLVAIVIGLCTWTMVTIGIMMGRILGKMVGKRAEMIGGFVLIVVGTSILCEHIGSSPGL